MLKKLVLLAVLVSWASSSSSEDLRPYYGATNNAAADALRWSMGEVLPTPPGLSINSVVYSYTIRKQLDDAVNVHVQNENALGTGYIFRETDEWRPGSQDGTEIRKIVGVGGIPRTFWGDGSIDVEGNGSVEDPNVAYTYTIDPCYDPQFSPNCPGYEVQVPDIPQFTYDQYNALDSDAYQIQYNPDDELYEDDKELSDEELAEMEAEEEKDREERLEKALAAADNSALFAQALTQSMVLSTLNSATNMNTYYAQTISGGVYNETISLPVTEIPDNKQGLRNGFSQQLLHQQMVQSQYEN